MSHRLELENLFKEGGGTVVLDGDALGNCSTEVSRLLREMDFALSVHFPEIIKPPALHLPRRGWINLHPSYLPFNRGWHTPSWAILDDTPAGVTLHLMSERVDQGKILIREKVPIKPWDTAHSLYQRLLDAEFGLIERHWETIRTSKQWQSQISDDSDGSEHRKQDLLSEEVRVIDLKRPTTAGEIIHRLRGLTTDRWSEAAYFVHEGERILLRIELKPADHPPTS